MILNYKASAIAKAEREHGLKLFQVMAGFSSSSFGVLDIVFLLQAGGATVEEVDDLLAKQGMAEAMVLVMEGLQKSGFLPKDLDAKGIREAMASAQKEALKTSGEPESE